MTFSLIGRRKGRKEQATPNSKRKKKEWGSGVTALLAGEKKGVTPYWKKKRGRFFQKGLSDK